MSYGSYDPIDNRKLVRIMTSKGIRTGELAKMTGLTDVTIANLRTGKGTRCYKTTSFRLADALGISPEELFRTDASEDVRHQAKDLRPSEI